MQQEMIEIAERDGRYPPEAFEFVKDALKHAQHMFDKGVPPEGEPPGDEYHISGRELLEGLCDLARREFGLMASVVFERWGVRRTDDFGEIVFALIEAGVLAGSENDRKDDFQGIFDLETALTEGYRILDEAESRWGR